MKKHAYLIIAHKQPELLKKLLKLLDNERHDFFIHIDKKSSIDDKTIEEIKKSVLKSNIKFIERISVNWGGYSQIQIEINLLKCAINYKYSYYHLLSGADLPLKSSDYIYKFFEKSGNKEFISFESSFITKEIKERISLYHFFQEKINRNNYIFFGLEKLSLIIQKLFRVNRIKNSNLVIQKGANWFDITHEFASYVLTKEDEIKKFYKNTMCADEIFLQTIAINSVFKEKLYYKNFDNDLHSIMRYIDWQRGKPYIFRNKDFDELIKSEYLFARKFDEDIDKKIINKIYYFLLDKE